MNAMNRRWGVVGLVFVLAGAWHGRVAAQEPPGQVVLVPPSAQMAPADPGWALTAGVLGVAAAAGVIGLTLGSVAANDDGMSATLGASATALLAIAGPVVAWGGSSARDNPLIQGAPSARTLGWVGYGLSLTSAVALLFVGAADEEVPVALIAVTGIVGAGSLVAFAVDAFRSHDDASSPVGRASRHPSRQQGPTLSMPTIFAMPRRDGGVDGGLAFGGSF